MNYYEVFGISPTASPEDINAAHKALAKQYHPDINDSTDAHERMAMLNEANEVLSDAAKRAQYDKDLKRGQLQGQKRAGPYSQTGKVKKTRRSAYTDDRAGKAELLRRKAEARLKTEEAARIRRKEQAKKKAEEADLKKKQNRVEMDRQHMINVLSAVVMGDNARRHKKKVIDEERHNATKVLLSLVRKDDHHLRRMAQEADHKQRIEQILSLVKEYNDGSEVK